MAVEKQIIGVQFSGLGIEPFYSYNPSTDKSNDYLFYKSTSQEIRLATKKATIALRHYNLKRGIDKATFLETIAQEILNIGEDFITICMVETALRAARIESKKGRTINQLKMFATNRQQNNFCDNGSDISFCKTGMLSKHAPIFITGRINRSEPNENLQVSKWCAY